MRQAPVTLKSRRGLGLPWLLAGAVFSASLASATLGCGHPATVAECEQIVERIASLEIQKRARDYSRDELKHEVEQAKQTLKETTMRDCVGKRITDRALECVRTAKTSQQIVDECFD